MVALKRDYYVSLVCQLDFVRNNPSRKTPQVLAVRGLRNSTTIEISLSRIHMVSGLVLERMWMTKAVQRIVMRLPCSRLSETAFPFLVGNIRAMRSLSPHRGLGRSGWFVGYPNLGITSRLPVIQAESLSCRTRKLTDLINLSGRFASIVRSSMSALSLLPE